MPTRRIAIYGPGDRLDAIRSSMDGLQPHKPRRLQSIYSGRGAFSLDAPPEQPNAAASSRYAGQHSSELGQGRANRPPHSISGFDAPRYYGAGQRSGACTSPANVTVKTWRIVTPVRLVYRIRTGV